MIKEMRHVGIVVKDFEESLRFYNLLGFKVYKQKQVKESSSYIDKISAGKNIELHTLKLMAPNNSKIELLDYGKDKIEEKRTLFGIGISHIAFTVENVEDVYNKLKAEGINFNSSPQISPDSYAKVVFCKSPEGIFVELVEVL